MQHRILRRVVLSFAVVIVAVSSLTLLGCGGDDRDTRVVDQTIPLDAANAAANNTRVVNDETFVVSGNTLAAGTTAPALKAALTNTNPALTFSGVDHGTGKFSTTNPTTSGDVAFASCTFTVTAPAALAGTIFIQNCSVRVTSNGVAIELGGDTLPGEITLILNGSVSSTSQVDLTLDDNGVLFVDGVATGIIITGTSGG